MSTAFRIATWNIDHPKRANRLSEQLKQMAEISADIIVLTETSPEADISHMGYEGMSSPPYPVGKQERNTSAIWSIWPIESKISTDDDENSTCAKIKSPFGSLLVYGTILTYHGDKGLDNNSKAWVEHDKEIDRQGVDWLRIQGLFPHVPLIVAGDFNQARDTVGTYHSPKGIALLDEQLRRNNLFCLTDEDFGAMGKLNVSPWSKTGAYRHNIDHICVTRGRFEVQQVGAWDNFTSSQELTDHNGVFVDLAVR
jgi:endonuclease/exonuclease/phosphatase family metal-dependent hydrolase